MLRRTPARATGLVGASAFLAQGAGGELLRCSFGGPGPILLLGCYEELVLDATRPVEVPGDKPGVGVECEEQPAKRFPYERKYLRLVCPIDRRS